MRVMYMIVGHDNVYHWIKEELPKPYRREPRSRGGLLLPFFRRSDLVRGVMRRHGSGMRS